MRFLGYYEIATYTKLLVCSPDTFLTTSFETTKMQCNIFVVYSNISMIVKLFSAVARDFIRKKALIPESLSF